MIPAARVAALLAVLVNLDGAAAETGQAAIKRAGEILIAAYPDALDRVDGGELVWKDGSRMALDDGESGKTFERLLAEPDIEDMFAMPYPLGRTPSPPGRNADPGRVRNGAFFEKMYGSCGAKPDPSRFAEVAWTPETGGRKLPVTTVNGVADKLAAVARELDASPPGFRKFFAPSAGTYNCRVIAGTNRASAHGYGVAIDINTDWADYWRWSKPDATGAYPYKNRIPWEIVEIFEKHGFIWGGKWSHYDTMHFEYRPELIAAAKANAAAKP